MVGVACSMICHGQVMMTDICYFRALVSCEKDFNQDLY